MATPLPFIALQKSDDETLSKIGFLLEDVAEDLADYAIDQQPLEDIADLLHGTESEIEQRILEAEEKAHHDGYRVGLEDGKGGD